MNRNSLNLAMTGGLVAVMDYRFTGNAVHEILGVLLAALFLAHNILNRHWYKNIGKGKLNLFSSLATIVNMLLLPMMLVVTVTGVLISQTVFVEFSLSGHLWVHQLHTFSAYGSLILCGIHLGLHWKAISGKVFRTFGLDSKRTGYVLIGRTMAIFVIGYGIHASFSHQIGSKLMFEHVFGGWGDKADNDWFFGGIPCYPGLLCANHTLFDAVVAESSSITMEFEHFIYEIED